MLSLRASAPVFLIASLAVAQTPVVSPGGVVNAASFDAPVSPGSLVSIFGSNLALQTAAAGAIPLPTSLAGVSVRFNGVLAPLLFVSTGQINAQLPWEVSANAVVSVVVTNNGASSVSQDVAVAPVSPGVFAIQGYAVAINPDGSLVAPSGSIAGIPTHPALPGETVLILATGIGPVNPPGVTGNNSLDALRIATITSTVLIGGVPAQITFAGLSPQFVGVDQLNVVIPPNAPGGDAVPVQIKMGEQISTGVAGIAIQGTSWTQWGQNSQHTSGVPVAGQDLNRILADVVYDPLTTNEKAASSGDLLAHFQVPLSDGNDVFMEFKTGVYDPTNYATQTWGEQRLTWQNGQLVRMRAFQSDWKAPGSVQDFWEPVFHATLANGSVYVPGASGSVIQLNRATGAVIQRFAPFGTDPSTYETGPIAADAAGNLYYNAVQVVVDPTNGFFFHDAIDSWLVKITPTGVISMASYKAITAADAPAPTDRCFTTFQNSQLPWPPSPSASPGTSVCGTVRVGMNVAPAVAADGSIYSVARTHFNSRYGFLVALNSDLSKKWVASLRERLNDGCGIPVALGGWLPPNGSPGGCRMGTALGVDPATNRPGAGLVNDNASSSPTVAPDGSVLYGAYTRYNYAQGHLMHFDAKGNYLGAFGFGWDYTPAIYSHDGTWSVVVKNNHYGDTGSYCNESVFCPADRTTTNPDSPEEYFVSQLSSDLKLEWSIKSTNTQSCTRNADGTLTCVSDHPAGFEWCVNAPVIDGNGVVYANSEDGNLYAIGQGGVLKQRIFQQESLGAAYTPASLGGDGKIYSQNNGHLFVVGK
ncbi:MAG TPA: IPT/TIG domain-containing protein [Bryobacteraceae bacterium]|nr:IPT/TIG domain-containing protein [Bryobacteraceae bacterium]